MRNGVRCTSLIPADDPSASMCTHHQRMARVMALAPKKPDATPSTSPPPGPANPLFPSSSVVHVPLSSVGALRGAPPLPTHVPSESFSDYLKVSFPGEVKSASLSCSFEVSSREGVPGTLIVTNYRLRFEPSSSQRSTNLPPSLQEAITPGLPTASVSKLTYPQSSSSSSSNSMPAQVVVHFRNCRTWVLRGNVTELMTTLNRLVFVESPLHLFAFAQGNTVTPDHVQGHAIYDLYADFAAMGVSLSSSPFRITDANRSYAICPTYPPMFVVPAAMSDVQVAAVAGFRSKGRMPLCCWVHSSNTASLWRCAQPKRGVFHAQNADDDHMLWLIAQTNKINGQNVWIVDCRPELNARANNVRVSDSTSDSDSELSDSHLTGGGTESGSIRHATVTFMNIANIHAMRESLEAVRQLALMPSMEADLHWYSRDTKWLYHVRLVLRASIQTAHAIHQNDEQAPIFVQFLDCVWQLHRQFPTYFEFTGLALLAIGFHATSGRFGTFVGNCDRDRVVALQVAGRTPSLWTFMLDNAVQFRNPFYRPYVQESHDGDTGALVPWPVATVLRRVVLWDEMYLALPSCGNITKPKDMAAGSFHQAKTAAEDLEMAMAAAQHQLSSFC
ncbi:hypothetical protein DYB26_008531 [Aphanomyces astaci]|uniref:Myotubularin phosphatase domain-containing protein n=1 Tax=Aphanomyces astaci TaxID=112090 RepID=A0A418FVR6_APHAT|nr:hypothetical protein DYB26_008531 [Aphanomyces astaci]